MKVGLEGEKRATDPIAQAVMIGRMTIVDTEEEYGDRAKRGVGMRCGCACADKLSTGRKRGVAMNGLKARSKE